MDRTGAEKYEALAVKSLQRRMALELVHYLNISPALLTGDASLISIHFQGFRLRSTPTQFQLNLKMSVAHLRLFFSLIFRVWLGFHGCPQKQHSAHWQTHRRHKDLGLRVQLWNLPHSSLIGTLPIGSHWSESIHDPSMTFYPGHS